MELQTDGVPGVQFFTFFHFFSGRSWQAGGLGGELFIGCYPGRGRSFVKMYFFQGDLPFWTWRSLFGDILWKKGCMLCRVCRVEESQHARRDWDCFCFFFSSSFFLWYRRTQPLKGCGVMEAWQWAPMRGEERWVMEERRADKRKAARGSKADEQQGSLSDF